MLSCNMSFIPIIIVTRHGGPAVQDLIIDIKNGTFDDFPNRIIAAKIDRTKTYIAERISNGGLIKIRSGNKGQHDFIVSIVRPDNSEERTTHVQILEEFDRALKADETGGKVFAQKAFLVVAGEEPPAYYDIAVLRRS